MDGILCSESVRALVEQLDINLSLNVFLDKARICLEPLAKEYGFGKLSLHLVAPSSAFALSGQVMDFVLFQNSNVEMGEICMEDTFVTGENGGLRIEICPERDKVWSEEERKDLHFITRLIYVLFGRYRMSSLLDYYLNYDNLTGALNMNGLNQYFGKLSAQNKVHQFSGFLLNIKNFRYINQVAGGSGGDRFLRRFVESASEQLHADEAIIRTGGDTFLVVLRDTNMGEWMAYLEQLEIGLKVADEDVFFKVNTRAGIYSMHDGDSVGDLMTKANMALQISRTPGQKEWIRFSPHMTQKMNHDKSVVQAFPRALLAREFHPYFQPKVDLETGKLIGCEALARWIVDGKMVPPMEFVPSLEQDGSICQLDFYILERVCRFLRKWIDAGLEPVPVAVNFSRMHFHNRSVGYDIMDILERFNINPELIEIEVTEMYGYENYENMLEFTNFLKASGIRVSVDDFGTGYSSLSLISNMNADTIKVDKSFLDKMRTGGNEDRLLVRHIVNMIRDLNFSVIAEGVETTDQVDLLRDMGCFIGQGYLFDKPLPAVEFEKRLLNHDAYKELI